MQCDLILKCEAPWAGNLRGVQEMMTIPVFPPKLKISYSPVVLWGPQNSENCGSQCSELYPFAHKFFCLCKEAAFKI